MSVDAPFAASAIACASLRLSARANSHSVENEPGLMGGSMTPGIAPGACRSSTTSSETFPAAAIAAGETPAASAPTPARAALATEAAGSHGGRTAHVGPVDIERRMVAGVLGEERGDAPRLRRRG